MITVEKVRDKFEYELYKKLCNNALVANIPKFLVTCRLCPLIIPFLPFVML